MTTLLTRANELLREQKYSAALALYTRIVDEQPALAKTVGFNIMFTERRLRFSGLENLNARMEVVALPGATAICPEGLSAFHFEKIQESGLFDPAYYLRQLRGGHGIGLNPLGHYLQTGWKAGLNPSAGFDTCHYLAANPDVAASGTHPFIHYVCQGHLEGRSPTPPPPPDYDERYAVSAPRYVPRLPANAGPAPQTVRTIAFYLPQFHAIPQNDAWWGQGFTEWTNVRPAVPQFEGHYQPHVPDGFLGHYDLLDRSVQARQIELARQYGISGFCFYLYWFAGERLLEQPLDNYLADATLDLPFCVCWANENWSRRWDGLERDLLMEQHYSDQDDIDFIVNASRYLRDPRYIRIDGKPLLLVYRPNLFPAMKMTALRWRQWCRTHEIGEIYLAYPQSFEVVDPAVYGFDAAVEFPPNNSAPPNISRHVRPRVADFQTTVYDWRIFVERSEAYEAPGYKLFRSACPSWDNTARKRNKGTVFQHSSPELFTRWLSNAYKDTLKRIVNPDEQIVFINAWNEWAEGAHLEPDQRHGYAWLQSVRDAQEMAATGDAHHPEITQARWNRLAMLFGDKPDESRYPFVADYEALLRHAKKRGVDLHVQNGRPSYKLRDRVRCIESRADLADLSRHIYEGGPFCFVVLQYNQSDVTIRCIESIKRLDAADQDVRIVVVDNKSDDVHIDAIRCRYANDTQVVLLYSDKNLGFAGGNNIGYRHARDVLKAGFCVVINNDAEVRQVDFVAKILTLFDEESFSVAGPAVLIDDGRQENPWNDYIYSIKEFHVLKSMRVAERADYLAGQVPTFRKIGTASPRVSRIRNALLQGAALIVSPIFMDGHSALLDERLFLYGEEFLLAAECLLNGHLTVYDSRLQVHHREGATTETLPPREKMMLGYDSAIASIALVLERLERQVAATRGEVVSLGQRDLIQSILGGTSKHVLIDLLFCQPGYHGGGEYGKAVFKKLVEQYAVEGGFELWGAINPDLFIDPWVWDLCRAVGVNLIDVRHYDDIVTLVNMDVFDSFFAPAIVVYTGYEYMKRVGDCLPFTCTRTRVIGTLHDIRDFELASDRKRILEARRAVGCTRELGMSDRDIQREAASYRELAEQLRVMYRNIISDERVDTIITISKYCENSIITHIGQPAKPMQMLMSPMKPRPAPAPFGSESPHDFSGMDFALLVHAAREEKNAASAVVAFDRLFEKRNLPDAHAELKVVLTGVDSLEQLGISKVTHRSRFICVPEVPPPQFEYLLSNAALFVYPSFNEGLGYPPIEAMSYGTRSVVSNTTAIPETCGKAVTYLDPYSVDAIAASLLKALADAVPSEVVASRYKTILANQNASLAGTVAIIQG